MGFPETLTTDNAQAELDFLGGKPAPPLYIDPSKASDAVAKIVKFTKEWPDPFAPNYPYSSAWATKKENKGKKDRPAGAIKPSMREVKL